MNDVIEIIDICKADIRDPKEFINILLDCGLLLEICNCNTDTGYNRNFILPQWIANLLITLNPGETSNYRLPQTGILNDTSIEQCWRPPLFPQSIHSKLYSILGDLSILYHIPKEKEEEFGKCEYILGRGRSSTYSKTSATALIPYNFNLTRPNELISEKLNNTICIKQYWASMGPSCPLAIVSKLIVSTTFFIFLFFFF